MTLKAERQIGNIWVLSVPFDQSAETLAQFAELMQADPDVQYADPVRRAYAQAAPDDPFYSQQWSLRDPLSGINVETAWALQPNAASVTGRGHRYRHPAASRPRGTRAAWIRLHFRP